MIAKHLLTSVFVILAFGVADSFAAASIRAGAVGASGASGTVARAGSLRVGSGSSLSTSATSAKANASTNDSSRMPTLPGGMPKVTTKPKLPSYSGGTVVSGDVDLSDVYNRIDTVEDKAEAAQSAAETAGTVASNAQSAAETAGATANAAQTTAENAANAVAGKLDKPTGGAGQRIVELDSAGNVAWIAAPESHKVQLGYADQKLYYCKVNDCGDFNANSIDTAKWGSVSIDGLSGADGKTTLLQLSGDKIQKCVSDSSTNCTGSWSDLVNLNTYAKDAEFQSLKNAVNNETTGLAAAHSKADNARTVAQSAASTASTAQTTANTAQTTASAAQTTADSAKTTAEAALPAAGFTTSAVEGLGFETSTTAAGKYVIKPSSGGGTGKVLKWTTGGGVEWGSVSPNVQFATFTGDNSLYYCGKSNAEICDGSNKDDGWVKTELTAVDGAAGKTAWLRANNTTSQIEVCYKETECTNNDTWQPLITYSSITGPGGQNGADACPWGVSVEAGTVNGCQRVKFQKQVWNTSQGKCVNASGDGSVQYSENICPGAPACSPVVRITTKDLTTKCWKKFTQNKEWNAERQDCVANGAEIEESICDGETPCTPTYEEGRCGPTLAVQCGEAGKTGIFMKKTDCSGNVTTVYTYDGEACTPKPVLTSCGPNDTVVCYNTAKTGVKVTWKDCDNNDMDIDPSYVYSGDDGTTPTVEAGTVEFDNDPNFTPTVTNVGTASAARFDFKLPKPQAGANGKEVKLQKASDAIQWQHDGDSSWQTLVPLSDIKGDPVCSGSFTIEAAEVQDQPGKTKYTLFCNE